MTEKDAERKIYSSICSCDGIKARDIAKKLNIDKTLVNRLLYLSPYMHDLCYRDEDYLWHGLIRQGRPHRGIEDYSGFYSTAGEFIALSEEEWFDAMMSDPNNSLNFDDDPIERIAPDRTSPKRTKLNNDYFNS